MRPTIDLLAMLSDEEGSALERCRRYSQLVNMGHGRRYWVRVGVFLVLEHYSSTLRRHGCGGIGGLGVLTSYKVMN